METKRDKILEKLRKLMNLKESAKALGNEGEAHAAAGIARLLMEYNLSEEDIPEQEKLENPVIAEEIPYKVEMSNCVWYNFLVSTVCEYNMCRSLIVSRPKNYRMVRDKFQIIGRKKNVEVVLYLISFLAHQFVIIGKRKYPNYKYECIRKYGITPKTLAMYMKSFLYGCVGLLYCKIPYSALTVRMRSTLSSMRDCVSVPSATAALTASNAPCRSDGMRIMSHPAASACTAASPAE